MMRYDACPTSWLVRSQKFDAGGDEKQGILFTWPKHCLLSNMTCKNLYTIKAGLPCQCNA